MHFFSQKVYYFHMSSHSVITVRWLFIGAGALALAGGVWWRLDYASWSSDPEASAEFANTSFPVELPALQLPAQVQPLVQPPAASEIGVAGQLGPAWLKRFDAQVAAGQRVAALRAALIMLDSQRVKIDPATRAQLIKRLAALLPQLTDEQARELLVVVQREGIPAEYASAVLARSAAIGNAQQRTALVRSLLTSDRQHHLDTAGLVKPLEDSDPRVRAAAAGVLAQRARAGDSVAAAALAGQRDVEVDPRVRRWLESELEQPIAIDFPEDNPAAIALPPAAERSRPYTVESVWEPDLRSSHQDCMNRSIVTVAADGSATVDTVRQDRQGSWHVRYNAWAWRDASGTLVVDGRNQPVTYLEIPPGGKWFPDSLQIHPDGTTSVLDDANQGSNGQTGMPGDG